MALQAYQFRPMSATDLPMVRRWLNEPHVVQRWGDPDEQRGLVSGDRLVDTPDGVALLMVRNA